MRLIDADALIRKFKTASPMAIDGRARQMVEEMPTIEPERKTGIWKNRSLNILYPEWERYECSVCGGYSYIHKYCPNCGARMEGDTE